MILNKKRIIHLAIAIICGFILALGFSIALGSFISFWFKLPRASIIIFWIIFSLILYKTTNYISTAIALTFILLGSFGVLTLLLFLLAAKFQLLPKSVGCGILALIPIFLYMGGIGFGLLIIGIIIYLITNNQKTI